MRNQLGKVLLAAILATAVAACTSTKKPETTMPEDTSTQVDTGVDVSGTEGVKTPEELERERMEALLADTTVYFDFDEDLIRPDYQDMLAAHGQFLRDNPDSRLVLEGHADERGTPEYNLALGERRGNAVANVLRSFGAGSNQISVISFGEESPADPAHTEAAWAKNRRVELKYQ